MALTAIDTKLTSTESLCTRYLEIRAHSLAICEPLELEDYVVQPMAEVSPPKWHLAHSAWFFEEMVLAKYSADYSRFDAQFNRLFNSYYKGAGEHWIQAKRGQLSRPTVAEVFAYREHVDREMQKLFSQTSLDQSCLDTVTIGLHHEQQHQELLLMDIKCILAVNPSQPVYEVSGLKPLAKSAMDWHLIEEGVYEIGHEGESFSYDNEQPRHKVYLQEAAISNTLVTNGEYLKFIEAGGYENPLYWLSQGWDWVGENAIDSPLYWQKSESWQVFTLNGLQSMDLDSPVEHISYFEADAYANWAGFRLPTEQESEVFLRASELSDNPVWWWTQSHYSPYPGFKKFDGALGEYNGKFMCNQFVLRGGCAATPKEHLRTSYRNFYQPHQRWMFSGIRLAKESLR
jgi:ergothioneine biosynthesis protein EgtB